MINTPDYDVAGTNAQEALNLLDSARQLIEAHLRMIDPNATLLSSDLKRSVPVTLTLRLELGGAAGQARESQALARLDFDTPDASST